jgi:hypothetical protein
MCHRVRTVRKVAAEAGIEEIWWDTVYGKTAETYVLLLLLLLFAIEYWVRQSHRCIYIQSLFVIIATGRLKRIRPQLPVDNCLVRETYLRSSPSTQVEGTIRDYLHQI